jgi:hypothetical protein
MQCASVLFYLESRQIFVHGFFGRNDPAIIITDGDQNAQRLHTFFQLVHGFKYAPTAAGFNPSSPATIKPAHYLIAGRIDDLTVDHAGAVGLVRDGHHIGCRLIALLGLLVSHPALMARRMLPGNARAPGLTELAPRT